MYDKIKQCQAGDERLRNDLLRDYRPFILKSASNICKRYVNPEHDDEFSIALLAFNEAIDRFDAEQFHSFLAFAEKVIRNKLVDYFRKERKFYQQIPMSSLAEHDEPYQDTQTRIDAPHALDEFARDQLNEARRLEVMLLQTLLAEYQVSMQDLVQLAPRHEDSRRSLLKIANTIATHHEVLQTIMRTKRLPLQELSNLLTVSRKTLEKHRKYLIATTLILSGSFPHVRSFLRMESDLPRKEGSS